MAKIIVLGDVHLGKGMNIGKNISGTNYNSRLLDQMRLLEWSLSKSLEIGALDIVITGDIFEDPKPNFMIIELFQNWLLKCDIEGISVHLIYGNHDILRVDRNYYSPLQLFSNINNVFIYQEVNCIYSDKYEITLLPFKDRKSLNAKTTDEAISLLKDQVKSESSREKIIIGHMAIRGSVFIGDEIKDITNEILLPVDFFDGFKYAIMGHIHKPQKITDNVMHIGSMDISNFGEVDDIKKIIIIDDDKDCLDEIELPTRKLNQVVIHLNENDDTNVILNKLQEYKEQNKLKDSIVNIKITMDENNKSQVDRKKIEEYLHSSDVFNITQISETKEKTIVRTKVAKIDNTMTIASAIKAYAEKFSNEYKDEFISIANRYYEKLSKQ